MNHESLRRLLAPWGALQCQPASDWKGEFPLPRVVADFYENVGPWGEVKHAHHGPTGLCLDASMQIDIPPLRDLWNLQAGFRWDGNTLERSKDWKDEWLLIAEAALDPFIFDISTGHILFARHGADGWYPDPFAPDLEMAIGAMATIANTKLRLGTIGAFIDQETFEILPAARKAVEDDLASYLGNTMRAQEMLRLLELW